MLNPLPYTAKNNRCWCLEWTCIRRHPSNHNHDIKCDPETSETDEGECNRGVDGPHVLTEAKGEKEEGDLEHHRETLDEEVQWPFLQPIAFSLAVSASLNH